MSGIGPSAFAFSGVRSGNPTQEGSSDRRTDVESPAATIYRAGVAGFSHPL